MVIYDGFPGEVLMGIWVVLAEVVLVFYFWLGGLWGLIIFNG
jgi:hypothetical protein